MADPKYKNLPFIAVGQPDVYESADLPEADQAVPDVEEDTGIVETLLVDPKEAFNRFNKATVDSTGSNFSDEAGFGKTGYSVHYGGTSSVHQPDESITQRLQRLTLELKEIKDMAKIRDGGDEINPASMLTDVEKLQRQIDSFSTPVIASSNDDSLAYGQLLTQLKTEPKKASTPKTATSKSDAVPNHTLYELHYLADHSQSGREASLECRVAQLEKLLGSTTENVALSESAGSQSVMDSLSSLSSKLHLLDEDNVDKLSARLQILLQTLTKVKESSAAADAESLDKVSELYDLVKKWDACADALPTIVDRLYTLQDLHQQAMEFSSSLKAMESAQHELSTSIGSHQTLLTDVHKTFSSNVDVIKNNVEHLEKRISSLK